MTSLETADDREQAQLARRPKEVVVANIMRLGCHLRRLRAFGAGI
jgi:hypothetical protein